jgi:hypothetical protein
MKEHLTTDQVESIPKQQNSKLLKSILKKNKPQTKLSFKNKPAANLPAGELLIRQDSSQME